MTSILSDDITALPPASSRISVGSHRGAEALDGNLRPFGTEPSKLVPEDIEKLKKEAADKARYKIEVLFHKSRSSLSYKPSPVMVLIWESGRRLHGGGDEKMYWCGYKDCGMPIPSDDFAYMHVVCRYCKKEMFLDPDSRALHIKNLKAEKRDSTGIEKMPIVVGEKLANLTPVHLAELLVKTWYQLGGEADVYFKYSPHEIRYDPLHETVKDMDNLDQARIQRKPGIYTLKRIREDIANGSDLKGRFLAMIVA